MKKIISILILLLVISLSFGIVQAKSTDEDDTSDTTTSDSTDIGTVINGMQNASKMPDDAEDSSIVSTINNVIGLIQLAGTGISVVVVTLLGIKYMLASPSEKADTKKMIMPILIGCILLFGAVNLVATVADFSEVLNTTSTTSGS